MVFLIIVQSSKIVFPNGSVDPWHILGVLDSPCPSSEPTSFMNGTAHCADLYPPRATDLPELTATRALEVLFTKLYFALFLSFNL